MGGEVSSGVRRSPIRRIPRPSDKLPLAQESGMEKMSPKIVGDIQTMREGEISIAADKVMTPNAVCARWRRAMLLSGIEPSSRRCGFQPVSRPDRIWATDPDWISIMIAANAAEKMISTIVEAM